MSGGAGARRSQQGFTIIELMIVVVVVAIMASLAFPSFKKLHEKMRLRGAAEALYSDLYYARSEALKTKRWVTVAFSTATTIGLDWCYGINVPPPGTLSTSSPTTCDCTEDDPASPDYCTKRVKSEEHPRVTMIDDSADADDFTFGAIDGRKATAFEPLRGTTFVSDPQNGTATFVTEENNFSKEIIVAPLGRIRIDEGHYHTE